MLRHRITDGGGQTYGVLIILATITAIADAIILLPIAYFGRGKVWGLVLMAPFALLALVILLLMFSNVNGAPNAVIDDLSLFAQAICVAPSVIAMLGGWLWFKARKENARRGGV